jgi:hypothetical protein
MGQAAEGISFAVALAVPRAATYAGIRTLTFWTDTLPDGCYGIYDTLQRTITLLRKGVCPETVWRAYFHEVGHALHEEWDDPQCDRFSADCYQVMQALCEEGVFDG